ncbi:uncharacterized protein LOC126855727 [Cataglyphis hispanica]|uniref:uncharacterized protein LOC126855727 n=1 Tax=Cataglyphis hispanica TaxID=1086592 RepID=UPI00217F4519|nr:uncharacterized protein LOC126855727 [Cataglyphis hispanica]
MRRKFIFIYLTWFFFLLHFGSLYIKEESGEEYSKGCAHLHCERGSQCIKRRFWCNDPPCPGMLYCSKSRKESLRGPPTCDTVRCNKGHICIIKVRDCHWDTGCKLQIARCVSEKEYYEGAASCVGFKCPSGKHCILRETHCINPPCKLIRSCIASADVQILFDECRSLNCTSEYECFLRRKEYCSNPWCPHVSDCALTIEDVLISKYCYGWICPRSQKCIVRIVGPCKGFNCIIQRSCRTIMTSSDEPTLTTSTQSLRHTTATILDTEDSLTHRQAATTRNLITKSFKTSTNQPDLTLPYSQFWWNYNKLSTNNSTDVIKITSKLADLSNDATSPAGLPVEEKIELTTSGDTKRLEMPKIYIASNNTLPLPMVFEDIKFLGNYPIWIKNDPYPISPDIDDEDNDAWEPQEPHRILLPPYVPVVIGRGQFLPVFINTFDRPFNEATALISLPELTFIDTKDNISTIIDNKMDKYINDSSSYYTNFSAMRKTNTIPPNIHEESDNYYYDYEQGLLFMIHDLKRSESESTHEQEFKSSIADSAMDNSYGNYTAADIGTFVKSQIGDENRSRISVTRFVDNNNATFHPSITTGQSDYSSRDEKLYGLANYPYDTISVDYIDKSEREYEEFLLNKILNDSLNEENQSDIPFTFPLDKADEETNVQ